MKTQNYTTAPLSGFRDMLAEEMIPRQKMLTTIQNVYEKYGFTPLDTPVLERDEVLTGKYGEEGEQLMYRFRDNGDRAVAMRYDLTVPLARVMTEYQGKLPRPYKRYQVGKVWRGDSPQAGRYREFMQFDVDIVGTTSPIADAEILIMMADAMQALGVKAQISVNNRLLLDALCATAGLEDAENARALVTLIDKIDKIGIPKALAEIEKNSSAEVAAVAQQYLNISGNTTEKFTQVETLLGTLPNGSAGLNNLRTIFSLLEAAGLSETEVVFDPTIARGLNYYTGTIYEIRLPELPELGSVGGGGRYDQLVADLGGPDLPAVGGSIGVDRLYEGLRRLNRISSMRTATQVMIANFEAEDFPAYMDLATQLRQSTIQTEIYYEPTKMGKQFKYADQLGIPLVVLLGSEEKESQSISIKNLQTGEQMNVPRSEFITTLQKQLAQ